MVESQIELLTETDWDNLIILDACRYDYFEEEYSSFLDGKLSKVLSPASCTTGWLKEAWKGQYDHTFVSANPHINSLGYRAPSFDYVVKDHFKKIIDVWKFGWCNKLGTVPPIAVNDVVLELTDRRNLIIHYVQPHGPYIGSTKAFYPRIMSPKTRLSSFRSRAFKLLGEARSYFSFLWALINIKKIHKAYRETLRIVLGRVAELIPHLEGKTIITSDHGEMLGEHSMLWHPCGLDLPELREVPWFEVYAKR